MIFDSKRQAQVYLKCTFTPAFAERHEIVQCRRADGSYGWTLVYHPKGIKAWRKQ